MRFFLVSACQKIRADHLQAVTARLVSSKHQAGSLNGLLHHGQLALIKLEIDNLSGLRFFAREMPFDLSLKRLFR